MPRGSINPKLLINDDEKDFPIRGSVTQSPYERAYSKAFSRPASIFDGMSDLQARTLSYFDDSDTRKQHIQEEHQKRRKRICEKDSDEDLLVIDKSEVLRQARIKMPVRVKPGKDDFKDYRLVCEV